MAIPRTTCLVFVLCAAASRAPGLDELLIRDQRFERRLTGRVLAEHDDGVLLLARDGQIWPVNGDAILQRRGDAEPWKGLEPEELEAAVLAELPAGFETYSTAHYMLCHNTSRAYAQWCGSLFERLYAAFTNYWKQRGFDLQAPAAPLVAIVFADTASYDAYARDEAGPRAASRIIGFYSLRTNRIASFDLSGLAAAGGSRASMAEITRILRQPDAQRTVATLVHEATHQLAFNTGLHARFADVPLWVSEGLAIYFETPDLESQRGWRGIGTVNYPRLTAFRETLFDRPTDAVERLVADDSAFRKADRATAAYAEAWAWHYFLLKQRQEQYLDYTRRLSAKPPKPPWVASDRAERLADFQAAFGDDWHKLDAEFVKFITRVR